MAARQEVRLKEAEAADQKKRLTETRSLNQPAILSPLPANLSRPIWLRPPIKANKSMNFVAQINL